MEGTEIRLGRIFGHDGKAVVVACDHGMFDGPHAGMVDIPAMLERLGDGPDAILLSPGMLRQARRFFARRGAPAAIVRINANSIFTFKWDYRGAINEPLIEPEDAAAIGADAVLACVSLQSGDEERDMRNLSLFADLAAKAHAIGVPIVGEYFPHSHLEKPADAFHEEVLIGCRMLAEMGADAIKTFHTSRFKEVTQSCPVPVLGLGAEKTPTDRDALELAEREVRDGARGFVFGRNAVQASNPPAFVAALHDILRNGLSAAQAAEKHGLTA